MIVKKANMMRQMWRHFGPEWLAFRVKYAAKLRTGSLRRGLPASTWAERPLASFLVNPRRALAEKYLEHRRAESPPFFFEPSQRRQYRHYFSAWDERAPINPVAESERISRGLFRYFGHTPVQAGFPPDWHSNPFTGQRSPNGRHWSEIEDFRFGDVKVIWEPSRFAFAYTLVRAYWRTGDEEHAELFWKLVEDWMRNNQPQLGANWKCGQEVSFRVMACCFGLYGLLDADATTPERSVALAQLIAVSGERIAANLDYAVSQRNNHGVSEGVGLWTIGLLFPELSRAEEWRESGREVLEALGRELIYEDGAFAQHSLNYHRLMLHDYLWALRLGDIQGVPFSDELRAKVKKSGQFLYELQDEESGRVPCYGHNDGALILPLSNCDYQDYRPAVQAANYYFNGTRDAKEGPWDEDLLWLFGPAALTSPRTDSQRKDLRADGGGYYTMRSRHGFAFVRCPAFRDRPGQADLLHLDLWWRGQNIVVDPGTYSYNAPDPWNNQLGNTVYHNTVTADALNQMDRAAKFLWLPWATGRVRHFKHSSGGALAYWEGEHDGYARLEPPVNHRRSVVRLGDEAWLVLDSLESPGVHSYRLHWLLPDLPHDWEESVRRLRLNTDEGPYFLQLGTTAKRARPSIKMADENSPRGWRSPYYNHLERAVSLDLEARAKSVLFWTYFGPEMARLSVQETTLSAEIDRWTAKIVFTEEPDGFSVKSVSIAGSVNDAVRI